jgi:integrase/recombinase XerD
LNQREKGDPMTTKLSDAVAEYLDHLSAEKGSSPNTLAAYRSDLEKYESFCQERDKTELAAINESDVSAFVVDLRSQQNDLAPSSVARSLAAVRGLHGFAVKERLVGVNVAVEIRPPAAGLRLPHALAISEITRLLQTPGSDAVGLRTAALMEFLYGSGCRVSEAVGCDVDDLDLSGHSVRLFGKGRKERVVPLGTHAVNALEAYLVRIRPTQAAKKGSPAVFLNNRGGRLTRQSVWNTMKVAAEKADLPPDTHPHTLRHSFATHLLQGGADIRVVQELLGHASVTTTQIYTQVTIEHLREVFLTTHPRAK